MMTPQFLHPKISQKTLFLGIVMFIFKESSLAVGESFAAYCEHVYGYASRTTSIIYLYSFYSFLLSLISNAFNYNVTAAVEQK
jgi:hypothetical protein